MTSMKKIIMFICFLAAFTSSVMAQSEPWKIINLEDVTRHGKNVDWDDETCTATFKGKWDRWIDVPDVRGDLTEHTKLEMTILKSDCMLKIVLCYKGADGKTAEKTSNTFYSSMNKTIEDKKVIKADLTDKGKIGEDILKNIVGIRISMAKGVDGKEEPWTCQFGEIIIK